MLALFSPYGNKSYASTVGRKSTCIRIQVFLGRSLLTVIFEVQSHANVILEHKCILRVYAHKRWIGIDSVPYFEQKQFPNG